MYRNISRDGCYSEYFQFLRGRQGHKESHSVVRRGIGIDDDGTRHESSQHYCNWSLNWSLQLTQGLLSLAVTGMLFEKIEQDGARLIAIALQAVNARQV